MINLKKALSGWDKIRKPICNRLNKDLMDIVCNNISLKSKLILPRRMLNAYT
jgi:hypothetical protein